MSFATAALLLAAAPYVDLAAIDRQVAGFTGAPIGATGGAREPVDRRLKLRACGSPVALSWRTTQQETVVVQCGDARGWRLFVPVQAAAAAAAATPVINRGDAVTIAVSGSGFTVSQPGEAMESGPVGSWIRVRPTAGGGARNRGGGEPIRARILRPGLVGLPLP